MLHRFIFGTAAALFAVGTVSTQAQVIEFDLENATSPPGDFSGTQEQTVDNHTLRGTGATFSVLRDQPNYQSGIWFTGGVVPFALANAEIELFDDDDFRAPFFLRSIQMGEANDNVVLIGLEQLEGGGLSEVFTIVPDGNGAPNGPTPTYTTATTGDINTEIDHLTFRMTVGALDQGQAFDFSGFIESLTVERVLTMPGVTGDYNDSGQVEQGDLDLVLQNWGVDTDVSGIPGGWTNDLPSGQIEQTELDGVLQNWGNTSAPDFSGSSVPEPASLALLAGLGVLGLRRRA